MLCVFGCFTNKCKVVTMAAPMTCNKIHPLRERPEAVGGGRSLGLSCLSWRLGVEAHNIIGWGTVPLGCEKYVGNYMLGQQYRKDSKAVISEALVYAKSLKLGRDGKDVWVFDIDETSLSNLPYFAKHGFGAEQYNPILFNKWVEEGKAPALPETLKLYKKLLSLGIKVVFLTGRPEDQRNITAINLKNAGYSHWTKLIFRNGKNKGINAITYKSRKREEMEREGYSVVGNIGDQWSDILGTHIGNRTFKLPDPMYYIS
ncbi:stem 28 kDa glycoprotein-like [Impatiens glandulifera]|uniref:stem 28 kDa glycoprotein-like n=1 Tax=Impatiens glandulifera TaxID=253017 RepID=UPI001FB1736F|nr:stem 28 kDa glycoprotein-like [Impatiens glandulifera]